MRPIDADALLKKLPREELVSRMIVAGMPTIDPVLRDKENGITYAPVKRGRWINTGEIWTDMYTADEDPIYKCSVCNEEVIGGSKHFVWCPKCGALMEEEEL